jgi:rhodanese-related sulfurtransferase
MTGAAVRRALRDRTEIGLLDVRPEGLFAEGHPLFAASFPLGRLEAEVLDRLPRRSVPLVVYGDGDRDAAAAVGRLRDLGYHDVSLLDGGLAGWVAGGGELFRDVNAPSKAFGELVDATAGTPAIAASDLRALLSDGSDVVVVDARRYEEYHTMSIPTAASVPGAELVLRAGALAPDPATLVVVNCAGRTRSIIGAQSLINAGLPNPVVALRNGTIGWTLAGLELDHGQERRAPDVPQAAARQADAAAWAVARKTGAGRISAARLRSGLERGDRTIYRFDVRSPEEYAEGHRAGFRSAPGGQLVQETDWFAPVRGALVVLAGDGGGRAAMTASWLAQMGWEVAILEADAGPDRGADVDADANANRNTDPAGGADPGMGGDPAGGAVATGAIETDAIETDAIETGPWAPAWPAPPELTLADPAQVERWLRNGEAAVIDVDSSPRFLAGHVPGAAWALRGDLSRAGLAERPGHPEQLVLTSADGMLARFAAAEVRPGPGTQVAVLAGGTAGWAASGRPLQPGPGQMLSPQVDVYRRPYEGTGVDPGAMQAYLDWEYGLVAQLERDGTHGFAVLT